jgi:hypothetical protein
MRTQGNATEPPNQHHQQGRGSRVSSNVSLKKFDTFLPDSL